MYQARHPDASNKGDFAHLPDAIEKSIDYQINNASQHPHARNNTRELLLKHPL
jgi:hypothetical protein